MRRSRNRWFALLLGLALVAGACGDAGQSPVATTQSATTPTTASSTAPPPTQEPTTAPPARLSWRLIADETNGRPYTVSVALSQPAMDRMWSYYGFETALPEVEFDEELVVVFTPAVSSSCPDIEFGHVVIDTRQVYATFEYPTAYDACTADANPHSFVVAMVRQALPDSFTLQLTEELVCGGCDDDQLVVDLTDPGFDEKLWGFGRILIVREGPPIEFPQISMGFATPSYGLTQNWVLEATRNGPTLARVIEPATGSYILDAGLADCPAGDCGDNIPELTDTCRTFVDAVPGADVWAIYTVGDDKACTWRIESAYELPPDRPDGG